MNEFLLREQIASLERCAASLGKPERGAAQAEALTPVRALAIAGEVAALSQERQECSSRCRPAGRVGAAGALGRSGPRGPAGLCRAGRGACAVRDTGSRVCGAGRVRQDAVSGKDQAQREMPGRAHGRRGVKKRPLRGWSHAGLCCLRTLPPGCAASAQSWMSASAPLTKSLPHIPARGAPFWPQPAPLKKELEFETYATGMTDEALAGGGAQDVSVSYFQGYIPAPDLGRLQQAARQNAWGLLAQDPHHRGRRAHQTEEQPRFVSLIYPVTDFLGTVPGYFEFDISGWFLLFLLVFFGIIFGDGGYGLLICAIAAVPTVRALASKKGRAARHCSCVAVRPFHRGLGHRHLQLVWHARRTGAAVACEFVGAGVLQRLFRPAVVPVRPRRRGAYHLAEPADILLYAGAGSAYHCACQMRRAGPPFFEAAGRHWPCFGAFRHLLCGAQPGSQLRGVPPLGWCWAASRGHGGHCAGGGWLCFELCVLELRGKHSRLCKKQA